VPLFKYKQDSIFNVSVQRISSPLIFHERWMSEGHLRANVNR